MQPKEEVEIEYVSAPLEFELPALAEAAAAAGGDAEMAEASAGGGGAAGEPQLPAEELARILQRFGTVEQLMGRGAEEEGGEEAGGAPFEARHAEACDKEEAGAGAESDEEGGAGDDEKLSKKKRKATNRLKIAELKQACERPDVVEVGGRMARGQGGGGSQLVGSL